MMGRKAPGREKESHDPYAPILRPPAAEDKPCPLRRDAKWG